MADDDLGLRDLTDDQLIELAREIAAEIGRREQGVYAAARAATANTRPPGPRAVPGAAPAYDWSIARRAAMMMAETLGQDWTFAVWKSPKGERRVYLDAPEPRRRSSSVREMARPRKVGKVTFHVDGSTRHPPGSILMEDLPAGCRRDRIEAILRFLEEAWDHWPSTRVSHALASTIPAAPVPSFYPA